MVQKYLLNITKNTTKIHIPEIQILRQRRNNINPVFDDWIDKRNFHLTQLTIHPILKNFLEYKNINEKSLNEKSLILKIKHYNYHIFLENEKKYCIYIDDYTERYFYNSHQIRICQNPSENIIRTKINEEMYVEFDINFYFNKINILDMIKNENTPFNFNDNENLFTIEFFFD